MTQQNLASFSIPEDKMQNVENALKTLETDLMPYLKVLTSDEKIGLGKMGSKTIDFVQKSLEYAEKNPEFVPSVLDLEEFKKDMEAFTKLRSIYNSLSQITNVVDGTTFLHGSDSLSAALLFYTNIKAAAKMKAPKANDIYNDLSERFQNQGNRNKTTTQK